MSSHRVLLSVLVGLLAVVSAPAPQLRAQAEPVDTVVCRVLDAAGRPVTGASIRLPLVASLVENARAVGTTDAKGEYRFEARTLRDFLALGGRFVRVDAPSSVRAMLPLDPVSVAGGRLGDCVLTAARELAFEVRDTDGAPVAGALVTVFPMGQSRPEFGAAPWLRSMTTEEGRATVVGVRAGLMEVRVDAPGHYSTQSGVFGTEMRLVVESSGWISGRVSAPDGGGIRLRSAAIHWRGVDEPASPLRLADGAFRATVMRSTPWRIEVQCEVEGQVELYRTPWQTGAAEALEVKVDPSAKVTPQEIEFVDSRADPVPGVEYRVLRLPTDIPDAEIESQARDGWAALGGNTIRVQPPSETGAVVLLQVRAPGYATNNTRLRSTTVREPYFVMLKPEFTVAGLVRGPDGSPLADALVDIDARGLGRPSALVSVHATWTDAQGRFEFAGVDSRPRGVRVWRRGFLPAVERLGSQQADRIEITLRAATARSCRVDGLQSDTLRRVAVFDGTRGPGLDPGPIVLPGESLELPFGNVGEWVLSTVEGGQNVLGTRASSGPVERDPMGAQRVDLTPLELVSVRGHVRTSVPTARLAVSTLWNGEHFALDRGVVPVADDGAYTARVVPGPQRLVVVDCATGVPLHIGDPFVAEGGPLERDLDFSAGQIRVSLDPPARAAQAAPVRLHFWSDAYPNTVSGVRRHAIDLGLAPRPLVLYFPEGDVRLVPTDATLPLDPPDLTGWPFESDSDVRVDLAPEAVEDVVLALAPK